MKTVRSSYRSIRKRLPHALRAELERNKVASVQTNIDEAVAEKFRFA
jgi:hypothetical protein